MDKQIWLNGNLVPAQDATVSVYDHGLLYGDGVFEGIRIYNGRIFKSLTHLKRLFESAKSIRLEIPYTIEQLHEATKQTAATNNQTNGYIRLCVTRGPGTLGIHPFRGCTPNTFIIADGISLYPVELYETGLEVITASTMRNHPAALSPRIKSMNYLNNVLAKIEAIDAGVLEAVMLNHEGFVAECTGDNLFIVRNYLDKQVLITPPISAGILEGVTRNEIIKLARAKGITVLEENLTKHDLYTADEMFLTGTAAEAIPVTKVDGREIGTGTPGSVTTDLITAFHALVAENAPED
ncbi:branched-chain-amino-acid transaminase [Poriferisphaera sp. WC338]|uniref:branched-chain-amino-acid transaminase n=1 Tax=Poriferisphaera sp. WC338 TaxID=3425129 RepID=UPI003D817C09